MITTLFVGDLSIYCEEKDLIELLKRFGPLESVQIKRKDDSKIRKPHLSYGFVKFMNKDSAEKAFNMLNGFIFLGRPLRVGWATNNLNERNHPFFHTTKVPTAQVHITFLSSLDRYPVTEQHLRSIFERFGCVLDVTINRVECNREQFIHSGFGFIHYELTPIGVSAALLAIQSCHDKMIDSIVFACTASHGLMNYLKTSNDQMLRNPTPMTMTSQAAAAAMNRSPFISAASYFSNNGGQTTPNTNGSMSSSSSDSNIFLPGAPLSAFSPANINGNNGFSFVIPTTGGGYPADLQQQTIPQPQLSLSSSHQQQQFQHPTMKYFQEAIPRSNVMIPGVPIPSPNTAVPPQGCSQSFASYAPSSWR